MSHKDYSAMLRKLRPRIPQGGHSSTNHRVYPEDSAPKGDDGSVAFITSPGQSTVPSEQLSDRAISDSSESGNRQDVMMASDINPEHAPTPSIDYGPWTANQLKEWKLLCTQWGLD